MNLKDAIAVNCVSVDLKGENKEQIIREMIELLAAAGRLKDKEAALRAIMDREKKMSTGMQNGIAIPHGKTDSVTELVTAVALRREPIEFESLDGQPCCIFVMTLSPTTRAGPHIQFLSEISRILGDPARRERLRQAADAAELHRILTT